MVSTEAQDQIWQDTEHRLYHLKHRSSSSLQPWLRILSRGGLENRAPFCCAASTADLCPVSYYLCCLAGAMRNSLPRSHHVSVAFSELLVPVIS